MNSRYLPVISRYPATRNTGFTLDIEVSLPVVVTGSDPVTTQFETLDSIGSQPGHVGWLTRYAPGCFRLSHPVYFQRPLIRKPGRRSVLPGLRIRGLPVISRHPPTRNTGFTLDIEVSLPVIVTGSAPVTTQFETLDSIGSQAGHVGWLTRYAPGYFRLNHPVYFQRPLIRKPGRYSVLPGLRIRGNR